MAIVGAASAAMAFWQFLKSDAFESFFGPLTQPNVRPLMNFWAQDLGRVGAVWVFAPPFAAFLSALLPALLHALLRARGGTIAAAAGVAFVLAAMALALTGTRMALLGGVAGVAVMLMLWGGQRSGVRRTRLVVIAVLVLGTLAASAMAASRTEDAGVLARITALFGSEREVSVSISGRQAIYGTLLDNWKTEPLLGVGLGNSRPAIEDVTTFNSSPHSYWLGLLAETGLIGTGLVALMMAGTVPHYRRLLRRPAGSPDRAFAVMALAASTALLVGSIFDNAMLVWQIGVLFWLLQGAVLSLSLRPQEDADIDPHATDLAGTEADNAG
jgi:O-antigen ligase